MLWIFLVLFTCSYLSFSSCFRSTSAYITVASFLLGALCSGIAGYVGMWVSVRANVRVSSAARRSAREALQVKPLVHYQFLWKLWTVHYSYFNWKEFAQVATRAGGLSAIIVVGMAVIGIAVLYATFYVWLGVDSPGSMKVTDCECRLLPLTCYHRYNIFLMFEILLLLLNIYCALDIS